MTDIAAILNGYFAGGGVPATLYIGLVDKVSFANFSPGVDTMASHSGWIEYTSYSEGTRQAWTPGAVIDASPANINNPGSAAVTPTVAGTIKGVFFCEDSTKGGTTGTLYGPWFFIEGDQDAAVGVQFKIDVKIQLFTGTPTG